MSKRRLKWFRLPIERPQLRNLANAMTGLPYNARRGHGFVLSEVRPSSISGRHVEKVEREIAGIDPFGEETKQTITTFVHSLFTVSTSAPGLEVVDAPRSLKMLISQLSALADFEVALTEVDVDPIDWLSHIEAHDVRAVVKEVEYADIAFRGGTTGALTVRGATDVRDAGNKIVGDRPKVVRRVEARIQRATLPLIDIALERDGRAQVPAEALDTFTGLLRTALVAAASR